MHAYTGITSSTCLKEQLLSLQSQETTYTHCNAARKDRAKFLLLQTSWLDSMLFKFLPGLGKSSPPLSVISSCICWDLGRACFGFAGQLLAALSGTWVLRDCRAGGQQAADLSSILSGLWTQCCTHTAVKLSYPCRWAGNALLTPPPWDLACLCCSELNCLEKPNPAAARPECPRIWAEGMRTHGHAVASWLLLTSQHDQDS